MIMPRVMSVCLAVIVFTAVAAPGQTPANSLYKRLGGYDAIAAVTDDFLGRLVATLDRFQVPPKEKDELLAAASGLKKDIVER